MSLQLVVNESAAPHLDAGPSGHSNARLTKLLVSIFGDATGLKDIAADSDFFDIGGDSLMAENIMLEIERQTGLKLQTATLLSAPTPQELAVVLARQGGQAMARKTLTVIANPDAPVVLVLVHGMSGSPLFVSRLGQKIRAASEVAAIRGYGLGNAEAILSEAGDYIDLYGQAARLAGGDRPLVLGGLCVGGLIACGMAQAEWQKTGKRQKLVLMDPPSIGSWWLQPGYGERENRSRLATLDRKVAFWKRAANLFSRIGLGAAAPGRKAQREIFKQSLTRAFAGFRPQSFPCDVLLIASSEWGRETIESYRDWLGPDATIRVEVLPGGHKGFQSVNREAIDLAVSRFLKGEDD